MIQITPQNLFKIKKIVAYLLYFCMVIVIITGLGITHYRTMEFITGGLLTKSISFTAHMWFLVPLILLFALHTILPAIKPHIKK